MTELVNKVAGILQWTEAEDLDYLEAVVPELLEVAQDKTGRKYEADIPGGVVMFIAKAAEYGKKVEAGVTGERLGDYQYSVSQDFPASILKYLPPPRLEIL